MYEVLQQVLTYLRGMWCYRWYALTISCLIVMVGWYKVYQMPDIYTVTASVQINTESVLRPLLRGLAIEPDLSQRMRLVTRTLLSRPNMEKLARMSDLDLRAKKQEQFDKLVTGLQQGIKLSTSRTDENIYTISYDNKNPEIAKTIVQNLVNIMIESTLGQSRENSGAAQNFLNKQLNEYEKELRISENRLKEFKQKNAAYMPTIGGGYFDRLQNIQQQKREAELLLNEANKRREELKRQLVGEEPVFGFGSPAQYSEMSHPNDVRIREIQSELDELLLQFTEIHPMVITLKESMKKLKEQKESDLLENPPTQTQSTLEENPVYQQLKVSLSEAEAHAAVLEVRVKEYKTRERELRKMVDTLPQVEADLNRLTQDYNINRQNYEEIRDRTKTAKLSEEVEQVGDNVKVKIIDPPRLPKEPSGPNRAIFNSLVFVLGLFSGLVVSFSLSQLRPVVYDQRTLRKLTGLPIFGVVSNVATDEYMVKKKIEYSVFALSLAFLFMTYGGIMYIEQFGL